MYHMSTTIFQCGCQVLFWGSDCHSTFWKTLLTEFFSPQYYHVEKLEQQANFHGKTTDNRDTANIRNLYGLVRNQFKLCPPWILPEAGAEGQHQPWEWTEARMGVRLLGRAMLGQTVVTAIIYGFVRTDLTGKLSKHIYTPDLGPKLPS